jgi:NAD(P)-dependent dehydrogenase (short-subunit alcohol dehydrogenase family)
LIAGVSGIVGNNLARRLAAEGWQVFGLARRPGEIDGVEPVAADLLDPASLRSALAGLRPSHVFITTWMRQPTEAENIRVNAGMVRHLLEVVGPAGGVDCVSLVTGLKHYLGPFEAYGKGRLPDSAERGCGAVLPPISAWNRCRPRPVACRWRRNSAMRSRSGRTSQRGMG